MLVCFFVSFTLQAQRGMAFEHITTDDGLSQNTPNVFFQDSRGLLWIGTQDGLNMYDGVKFHHFKREVDNINSLSDNLIHALTEDTKGNIWIGTEGGLNVFKFATQEFVRYIHHPIDETSIISNNILALHCDKDGTIWVGTDEGLVKYIADSDNFITIRTTTEAENVIRCFFEDSKGNLMIGSNGGLAIVNKESRTYEYRGFERYSISGIVEDGEGNIWAGGSSGLFKRTFAGKNPIDVVQNRYLAINTVFKDSRGVIWFGTAGQDLQYLYPWWKNPKLKTIRSRKTDPTSLSHNDIISIFEDKAGIFWVGTNGYGANKYDRNRIKFETHSVSRSGLADNTVRSILEDQHGILWVGTNLGLNKLTEETELASVIGYVNNKIILSLFEDKQRKEVWVGTAEDGVYVFDNSQKSLGATLKKRFNTSTSKGLLSNAIRAVYRDKQGTIWVGTDKGGLAKFDPKTESFKSYTHDPNVPSSISNNRIRGIYEGSQNVLWISTYGGGLNKMDRENEVFAAYRTDVKDRYSISTNRIYPVHEDKKGNFWVATYGGGINLLDRVSGKFVHYTEEDGLPNNVVYSILEDNSGNLWSSTNKGLSRFDPQTKTFTNFGIQDGLQANEFNAGAYEKGASGTMYFGGINGLNYFIPDSIKGNSYIAPLMFTNFEVNNKKIAINDSSLLQQHISLTKEITLDYNQNSFAFWFASLHYSFPQRNKYQYKLEGFDHDWIETSRGEAHYTNLDAGVYTFYVKGSNSDGVWNPDPISIQIKITAPWYDTWTARGSAALVVLFILFGIYQWRVWRVERKRRQLEDKVSERTYQLFKEKEKVEEQHQLLQVANKKITDSIRYAQRIQDAIIPSDEELKEALGEDYFVFFQPRDMVSGDFYWVWRKNGISQFAVIDCTGHGVPGAIMSVIGFAMLEQTTKVRDIELPSEILLEMNNGIIDWLKQHEGNVLHDTGQYWKSRDGMDMTIISLNKKMRQITFSGAKNSMFIVQNKQVEEIKGDKYSIGGELINNKEKAFTDKTITLEKGAMVYMTTDGFLDQFGGTENKKFTKKRFKELLIKIDHLPIEEQHKRLQESLNHWKGSQRQIDDILVAGFRVS